MMVIPELGRLRQEDQEFIHSKKKTKKKNWARRQIIEMLLDPIIPLRTFRSTISTLKKLRALAMPHMNLKL